MELPSQLALRHRELLRQLLDDNDALVDMPSCHASTRIVSAARLRKAALMLVEDIDNAFKHAAAGNPEMRKLIEDAEKRARDTMK